MWKTKACITTTLYFAILWENNETHQMLSRTITAESSGGPTMHRIYCILRTSVFFSKAIAQTTSVCLKKKCCNVKLMSWCHTKPKTTSIVRNVSRDVYLLDQHRLIYVNPIVCVSCQSYINKNSMQYTQHCMHAPALAGYRAH